MRFSRDLNLKAPSRASPRTFETILLDAAEQHENQDDRKDQPQSSGWIIAPIPAMGPPGQCAEKSQNQNHYQNYSKDVTLLVSL